MNLDYNLITRLEQNLGSNLLFTGGELLALPNLGLRREKLFKQLGQIK
ncbi:hypothetical protein GF325_18385 [Candidatus Bathyarchaeota archaeon]|nr:hypothetical protein [Candidatus Bathyarchaeota archaeon]